ncbi:OmpA family protein [Flavobacterium sp. ACAM 123]|uniref:OmpA family protein n=1 Tax=Flavobacterium sp. ACAM 123 TaxID=1189620 RepID=UPI0003126478|nr:OmpA family protein [Flavobacterium sp. ACAM 123]
MKKFTILSFLVLTGFSLKAQNKETKNADKLFEQYEYVQAAKEYLLLVEKGNTDTYVYKRLGDSNYNMANTVEAEKWYEKAIITKRDAALYYNYAQVLKSNGKYEESNVQMKQFASMKPNDQRAIDFIADKDYLSKLLKKEKLFLVNKLEINSEKSDFGAVMYDNTLYFASARNVGGKTYGVNNEPFLDIYQSTYNTDGTYSEPSSVSELNTRFHEGPVSLSKDGNAIYFASESFNDDLYQKDNVNKLKIGQVNLYKARKENGKWTEITPLSFNSKSYSTNNPSIAQDGKTLYFSSNMPGSIGGIDIWKVEVNSDGSFGTPENLGNKINTPGDESFPFIADDNLLYFSSKGLTGFGGYDIFSVDLKNGSQPNNIGKPINSEKDDFAFTLNKDNNIGFVSSNRSGVDNIYSAIPICKSQIVTVVKNSKTGNPLSNSRVALFDKNDIVVDKLLSNESGELTFDVDCNKEYVVGINKDGFISQKSVALKTASGSARVDISLVPIEEVVVTEVEIILNTIYFENNRSAITTQAAEVLDKLVYIMAQNPELAVYVKSHTDSRGKDDYNMNLSERRAKSTVDYIVSKGVSPENISGKGFGESELKIECDPKCSEDDHATNRRSEFMIVKK